MLSIFTNTENYNLMKSICNVLIDLTLLIITIIVQNVSKLNIGNNRQNYKKLLILIHISIGNNR
jgi:hypothetical protein